MKEIVGAAGLFRGYCGEGSILQSWMGSSGSPEKTEWHLTHYRMEFLIIPLQAQLTW